MFKSGLGVTYEAVTRSPTLCRTQQFSIGDRDEQDSTTPVSVETPGKGFFGRGDRRTDNGIVMTVIVTLNYMIGSGILNTPQIFRESGLAAATILFLLACMATWMGAFLLIGAAEASSSGMSVAKDWDDAGSATLKELNFASALRRTVGRGAGMFTDLVLILAIFGANCSYIIIIGGLVTSLITEWTDAADDGVVLTCCRSFFCMTPLLVLVFVIPPSLIRHVSNLRWFASFSLLAVAAVMCLVVFGGSWYGATERATPEHDVFLDAPVFLLSWMGALNKFGSTAFSIGCAPVALHAYSSMRHRNQRDWSVALTWAILLGTILCYTTGIFGYLSFREATSGDILDNFTGTLASCFKILVVVHLLMFIPNEVVILRHSIFSLMGRDVMEQSFCVVVILTVVIMAGATGLMMALMSMGIAEGWLALYGGGGPVVSPPISDERTYVSRVPMIKRPGAVYSWKRQRLERPSLYVAFIAIVTPTGELFGHILDLLGGFTGSNMTFILPSLAYLKATEGKDFTADVKMLRRCAGALMAFGLAVLILVPTAVFVRLAGVSW